MVTTETIKNIPSEEDWKHMMQTASPIEAIKLWQLSIECLDATNSQDQDGWGRRIGIAERILDERKISRH
ncbi:MAG: hypothetical protein ACRD3F_12185 [Acidobacteriaceae bacterium]